MDSIDKYLEESAQVAHDQKQLKSVFMIIANEVLKSVQEGGTVFFCLRENVGENVGERR